MKSRKFYGGQSDKFTYRAFQLTDAHLEPTKGFDLAVWLPFATFKFDLSRTEGGPLKRRGENLPRVEILRAVALKS